MNDELPQGWATATLKDLVGPNGMFTDGDWILSEHLKTGDDVRLIQLSDIGIGRFLDKSWKFISAATAKSLGVTYLRHGDILISRMAHPLARACVFPQIEKPAITAVDVAIARCDGSTSIPGYLMNLCNSYRVLIQAEEVAVGTTRKRISRKNLEQVRIPLPPLAEQRRMVAKLEKLSGRVDACQQRLAKIPSLIRRFRQSIFDSAITGKLTAAWRNDDGKNCNARSELELLLVAAERERPRVRGAEPTEGHEALTDAIPDEWAIPSLDDLFRFIDYRGKTPKKSRSGKRLISAKNIKMGYISEEPIEYVSEEFYDTWMTRGFPKIGDIFFVTEGHTMGFAALNNRSDEFALSQRTITLQPWQPIEMRCFLFFIMSSLFQKLVRLNATGSAAVGIKAAKFRGLPIPFPPLSEQREIARQVDRLLKLVDQIGARFEEGQERVDSITQALLAKAFRGELVPTEFELAKTEGRSFQSAEELLERIGRNGEPKAKKATGGESNFR